MLKNVWNNWVEKLIRYLGRKKWLESYVKKWCGKFVWKNIVESCVDSCVKIWWEKCAVTSIQCTIYSVRGPQNGVKFGCRGPQNGVISNIKKIKNAFFFYFFETKIIFIKILLLPI